MPPSVLPMAATASALQNRSGLNFNSPNSAGPEPSGSSVAATKATTNRVPSPNCGSASSRSRDPIRFGMRANGERVKWGRHGHHAGADFSG